MKVHITHIGCQMYYPIKDNDQLCHTVHIYFLQAANGLVDKVWEVDEPLIDDGDYELPDDDWTYNPTKEYGEDLINEKDLLGCSLTQ